MAAAVTTRQNARGEASAPHQTGIHCRLRKKPFTRFALTAHETLIAPATGRIVGSAFVARAFRGVTIPMRDRQLLLCTPAASFVGYRAP